jgi:A/G-specific adenine glycosylase
MSSTALDPPRFTHLLLEWHSRHGRHDLPWQVDPTPYRVLVSEIMLQQTQVATVIPYYANWMNAFPSLETLANASDDRVMALWQGLGYYSRARNLQKAAHHIVETCGGTFPHSLEELQQIPGVGRYTAGAIAAFAYNEFGPIVDGNVKRLFCRLFGIEGQITSTPVNRLLWELAHRYTPAHDNRAFAQGLLDMGATLCTPKSPSCNQCPFETRCVARQTDRVLELPTPKPKKLIPTRSGRFLWQERDGQLLLEKRPDDGIWGGLWCLPELAVPEEPELAATIASTEPSPSVDARLSADARLKGTFDHTFSHYKLKAEVWQLQAQEPAASYQAWFSIDELQTVGLPAPIRKFLNQG